MTQSILFVGPARRAPLACSFAAALAIGALCGCGGSSPEDDSVPAEVGLDERPANPTCVAAGRPPAPAADVAAEIAFPGLPTLSQPLFLTQAPPGNNDRFYLVEKEGRILSFTGDGSDATVFADVSVDSRSEGGLLGLAFHPDFGSAGNRQVFLSYTTVDDGFVSRVSRFSTNDDGTELDGGSEQVILQVDQDAGNHNGGWIGFGPDGYLYIAFGDGGGSDDQFRNGQNPASLKAKILRIDIDRGSPYAIPDDNPFLDSEVVDEAFAWGLRNPWRASFDTGTGTLWAADVGQGAREEVDIVRAGANLGWPIREGTLCFDNPPSGTPSCETPGLTDPVHEYGRGDGRSITGGYVYRGDAIPGLVGKYVFADYRGDEIWALTEQPDGSWERETILAQQSDGIASFGQDNDGEIYVVNLNLGRVQKLVPNNEPPATGDFPTLLSETGCMDADDPREPGPMLIPYEPAATLWSDDAAKQRWLALPDGQSATVGADGDFDFPIGTVLVKQFERDGRLLETRFYLRHTDGDWGGYTYRWNDDQSDAILLADAGLVETSSQTWRIPSRAQCQQCHTAAAGFSLGLEIAQLNGEFSYPQPAGDGPNRRANQLRTLEHIGIVSGLPPEDARDAFPRYDSDAPIAERARAYLHSNCSNCHRPDGGGRSDLDLRYTVPLADTGLCAEPELDDFDIANPLLLAPGAPERSVFLFRMNRLGEGRMPQIGTVEVDDLGTDIMRSWIDGLSACE